MIAVVTGYEAAACRKKGAVNTPSEIHFFENGSGGFDLSQNRRLAVLWPQKTICHYCGFFYTAGQTSFLLLHDLRMQVISSFQ